MSWAARVTVAAIVPRDNALLFVEEWDQERLVINQPAGHLEPGESLLDAVVRETREETCWLVEPSYLVGVYRWVHTNGDTYLRFTFACRPLMEDSANERDADIQRVLWLTADDARAHRARSPLVRRAVEDYQAGQRHDLGCLVDVP